VSDVFPPVVQSTLELWYSGTLPWPRLSDQELAALQGWLNTRPPMARKVAAGTRDGATTEERMFAAVAVGGGYLDREAVNAILAAEDRIAYELALRELEAKARPGPAEDASRPAEQAPLSQPDEAAAAVLSLYSKEISDERFRQAIGVLADEQATVNERLERLDSLIPIPPSASASRIAKALRTSKAAVIQSCWWQKHRKNNDDEEFESRRERLLRNARRREYPCE